MATVIMASAMTTHLRALAAWLHRRPGLHPDRLARRLVCDLPGGDVGGNRGQFRIGPRPESLAYPHIKLVFGNPAGMHKSRP